MTHRRPWSLAVVALVVSLLAGCVATTTRMAVHPPECSADECGSPAPRSIQDLLVDWRDQLTGGDEFDPADDAYASTLARIDITARTHIATLTTEGEPWPDLDTSTPMALHEAYTRLNAVALAWSTRGSETFANEEVLDRILRAFAWLGEQRYTDDTPFVQATWWYWQLGIPLQVNALVVLLRDVLPDDEIASAMAAVEHFSPTVVGTGANRLWSSMVVGLRAVIEEDPDALAGATEALGEALATVESGDGYYADGSFIQHKNVPYNGGYGLSLIRTLANYLTLVANSPWEPAPEVLALASERLQLSIDPLLFDGVFMDAVRGREIARYYTQDRTAGASAITAGVQLAAVLPAEYARDIRPLVRRWLDDDRVGQFWRSASISDITRAIDLTDGAEPADPTLGMFAFNGMDRAVFRAPEYAFAVSMSSSRIAAFESISGENLKGWYTAAGATALYGDDITQFSNGYWATVNPYRLPGTTVDSMPRADGEGHSYVFMPDSSFAGSLSSASGGSGGAGMQYEGFDSPLVANKAWFFFDDEIVALGSGITATGLDGQGWDGQPRRIETIVDSRRAAPSLARDIDPLTSDEGWVHIADDDNGIGYLVGASDGSAIHLETTTNSGAWADVNNRRNDELAREDRYSTIWIDHGDAPSNDTYAYTVLPDTDVADTRRYAEHPEARVLANDSQVSAVQEAALGVVAAVFWSSGSHVLAIDERPFLDVDGEALVMVEESDRSVAVTVTDPTQRQDVVFVELMRAATGVARVTEGVTVVQLAPTVILRVDTAASAGSSHLAVLQYGDPALPIE